MKSVLFIFLALFGSLLVGCSDDDVPPAENEEEVINNVTLTFTTPDAGGAARVFYYNDPDGQGTTPATKDSIILDAGTVYSLTITLKNTLNDADEDISQEVREEGEEHQIFFGWTGALFTSPTGLGNIGEANKESNMNYADADNGDLPIGLATIWETSSVAAEGKFRILLKHQPGIKTATSSSDDGETDLDIEWNISVVE